MEEFKSIRIQNDFTVRWTIVHLGLPEDFTGKDLTLELRGNYGKRYIIKNYLIEGNTLTIPMFGKDHKDIGTYFFTLLVNDGKNNMSAVDSPVAFRLVGNTEKETVPPDYAIDLSSEIAAPANGLSAYELAVAVGYKGTLEEWLESLRLHYDELTSDQVVELQKPATDAAKKANDATNVAKELNAHQPVIVDGFWACWNVSTKEYVKTTNQAKGDPFVYEDFTPEQITGLQKPATDAAAIVDGIVKEYNTTKETFTEAENGRIESEKKREAAEQKRQDTFGTSEETRGKAFQTSEEERQKTFDNSQKEKSESYLNSEQEREKAFQTVVRNAETATNNANTAAANTSSKVFAAALLENVNDIEGLKGIVADLISGKLYTEALLTRSILIDGAEYQINGNDTPSEAPEFTGQIYIDETNKRSYMAVGNASVSDWKQITV